MRNYLSPENKKWGRAFELLVCLSVDFDRSAPKPWRLKQPIVAGEPDPAARFQELEAAVADEVERAIDAILKEGVSQPLSERARFWFGVRVDACIQFAALLSTPDCFIPAPALAIENLARWILIDWWRQHGASFVTMVDAGDFPSG